MGVGDLSKGPAGIGWSSGEMLKRLAAPGLPTCLPPTSPAFEQLGSSDKEAPDLPVPCLVYGSAVDFCLPVS